MTDLINTLEAPGEFDALATLRPGEPYFILVARDRFAPKLVQEWADLNRRRALESDAPREQIDLELRKSTQAETIGWSMQRYKAGHAVVAPATSKTAAYSGHVLPPETAERDRQQRVRAKVASALNNCVAELVEAAALLETVPDENHSSAIRAAADSMRQWAIDAAPQRPGLERAA